MVGYGLGSAMPQQNRAWPKNPWRVILENVGLVAIGRNEADRLRQCLTAALGIVAGIVYVDSGSTDGSVELAKSLGVEVVALDLSLPFTAARARNAGCDRLLALHPQLKFVQFVDGDCELVAGWLLQAWQTLQSQPQAAVVCGRRRERFPNRSLYNRLCDLEWNTPIGNVKACGGDAMMRIAAIQPIGGFNPTLIAGEEPELCVRLRQTGWQILRLDAEMTLHDAQMTRFSQWWQRSRRAGHAYAEGAWLHGQSPERHWVKETNSIWLWGLAIPAIALGLIPLTHGLSLLLLLGYPLLIYRTYRYLHAQGHASKDAILYALSCAIGKFPNVLGQLKFHLNTRLGQRSPVIEYK